jgi:hypothetical protein
VVLKPGEKYMKKIYYKALKTDQMIFVAGQTDVRVPQFAISQMGEDLPYHFPVIASMMSGKNLNISGSSAILHRGVGQLLLIRLTL